MTQNNQKTVVGHTTNSSSQTSPMEVKRTSISLVTIPNTSNKPIGISLFGLCFKCRLSESKRRTYHRALVLVLTYIAFVSVRISRRPLSVVKNVLNRNCTNVLQISTSNNLIQNSSANANLSDQVISASCSWAPFDDDATANTLFAYLDFSFLLSYGFFMFVSGVIAERVNLRYYITIGGILTGLGLIGSGLAETLDIHSLAYFIVMLIFTGIVQTTVWPVVVTCVSNWFIESNSVGLVYGIWNSHTSIGNILGTAIAGMFLEESWGMSFMVPGFIMIAVGVTMFLFLAPKPEDVGLLSTQISPSSTLQDQASKPSSPNPISCPTETSGLISPGKAITFIEALKIPGVIEYSMCLFFAKWVSFTFLFWLPRYIKASTLLNPEDSAYLSIPFDIGGIIGSIWIGHLSDRLKMDGLLCFSMFLSAIPMLIIYQLFGSYSNVNNVVLQLIVGSLVNGPYSLIRTSVSADLGNRIKDNRSMATVSSVINGMGSVGAAFGPLVAGLVSSTDWQSVFVILMVADLLAALCILRITMEDVRKWQARPVETSL